MTTPYKEEPDWKLRLRYGQLKTPYLHFTLIAEGLMTVADNQFECPKGNAFFGMKAWAPSAYDARRMTAAIGKQLGFEVTGRTEVFETAPDQPPGVNPHGYDIMCTPFRV